MLTRDLGLALRVLGSGMVARSLVAVLVTSGFEEHPEQAGDSELWREGRAFAPPANAGGGPHPLPAATAIWVLCADAVDAAAALALNDRCLEEGSLLLPGWAGIDEGQVGPLVGLPEGACLRCLDLRLQATTGQGAFALTGRPRPDVAEWVGAELAAQVIRVFAGDRPAAGQIVRLPASGVRSRHVVRPTWECPTCSGRTNSPGFCRRASAPPSGSSSPDRTRILAVEPQLVDSWTGPVRALARFEPEPRDPPLRHWVATLCEPAWARHGLPAVACGGTALDDDTARAAALGEALDRMSAPGPEHAELPLATPAEVADDGLHPLAWDLFDASARQDPGFPFPSPGPEDALTWVWGFSLSRSRPVLVPAARVFVPPRPRTPADVCDHPVVSGFATGSTWNEAALAGTLEVVERDALRIAWANRLTLPAVDLEASRPAAVPEYVDAFRRKGLEVRCRLVVLDTGIPVALAMVRSPYPEDPPLVMSAAAGMDVDDACRGALAELAANRYHARSARPLSTGVPELALSWWEDETAVVERADERQAMGPTAALAWAVDALAAAGLEVVVVDLTPPWVADLGLRTVKALVPGTYPLPVDDHWPHMGGHRLTAAPVTAGLLDAPLPRPLLNLSPLPFP